MHAIITLFNESRSFQPITRRRPVGMLPVLNRPLLEWQIMNFVRNGIKKILIIAVENPLSVGNFVGTDTRWGACIEMLVYKDPYSSEDVLKRVSGMVEFPAVLIPSESMLDFEYEKFSELRPDSKGKPIRIMSTGHVEFMTDHDGVNRCLRVPVDAPLDTGCYVFEDCNLDSSQLVDYFWDGSYLSVASPRDLWKANMASIGGCFHNFLGPDYGTLDQKEPHIGHHTVVDSDAIIKAPSFIGDYCRINSGARIAPFSVLGDGVLMDHSASIVSSVIFNDTYVGADANIEDSMVMANVMINIDVGVWTSVGDPFLLSGVNKKITYRLSQKIADRVLGALLFLLTSPVWIFKGISRLARGKTFFASHPLMVRDLYFDPASKDAARARNFFYFNDAGPFVERLPTLIQVILGKLRLVGVRPLKEEDFDSYQEDWKQQRFEVLDGLFTPVDAECDANSSEEEKIAVENYYSATRNLKEDLKILLKAIKKLSLRH
jgi:mannose-1-phosphate guanylyltransferase / phosphomannomutase